MLAGTVPLVNTLTSAADQGVNKLDALFSTTQSICSNHVVLAGYSLGAWVIDKWLAAKLSPPSANVSVSTSIRAVELYGDPLWLNGDHKGIARRVGQSVTFDPYDNTPPGYKGSLADRWQSLCLANDPICGEGSYSSIEWSIEPWFLKRQAIDAGKCAFPCEHWKYALSPVLGLVGYGSTKGGGGFLASKAFH